MKRVLIIGVLIVLSVLGVLIYQRPHIFRNYATGDVIDSLNHVYVYYNGSTSNVEGRSVTPDGYNLGLKYQCVEFVKRYYYEYYQHKMPNSYGNAVDFFNVNLTDGQRNEDRALTQYSNPSAVKPKVGDLVVFGATTFNGYGHVAIIADVREDEVQIVQQNGGIGASSRLWYDLTPKNGRYRIENDRVLGWLRKEQ